MYRLMYKDPEKNAWVVVSTQQSLDEIKAIWDSIFWSVLEKSDVEYGGMEDFLRIDNLTTGKRM